jgi:hypothetical protein
VRGVDESERTVTWKANARTWAEVPVRALRCTKCHICFMNGNVAGLFVGEATFEGIRDNLDLERWFRVPKSHERRLHGRRHAGVRIVQEGPTMVHALDAHVAHPGRFTGDDLLPYLTAREPTCQREALNRRKIMRKARSQKKRPILLADLERRYRESSSS